MTISSKNGIWLWKLKVEAFQLELIRQSQEAASTRSFSLWGHQFTRIHRTWHGFHDICIVYIYTLTMEDVSLELDSKRSHILSSRIWWIHFLPNSSNNLRTNDHQPRTGSQGSSNALTRNLHPGNPLTRSEIGTWCQFASLLRINWHVLEADANVFIPINISEIPPSLFYYGNQLGANILSPMRKLLPQK